MSEPFLAEIKMVGFNFAPRGWALCDGQILPINQNQSLYSLLGTTYGGDGRTSFALPDLRGRVPIHVGNNDLGPSHSLGQKSGEETHTVTTNEMPNHRHTLQASTSHGDRPDGSGNLFAATTGSDIYVDAAPEAEMQSGTIANAGGGQAHENMQPYLVVNFCIALRGLFPSRS